MLFLTIATKLALECANVSEGKMAMARKRGVAENGGLTACFPGCHFAASPK